MKSFASLLRTLAVVSFGAGLCALAPGQPPQIATAIDAPLVIANGKFTRDGKSVPATVRNLVELIRQRYDSANITVVDVDDVVVDHLTLHWAQRHFTSDNGTPKSENPPLASILAALSMASAEKFTPVNFGPNDFVLRKWGEANREPAPLQTEVFNLTSFISPNPQRLAELQIALDQAEADRTTAQKRYAEKHPRIIELTDRIDALKASLAAIEKSNSQASMKDKAIAVMDQIREVVTSTLALQRMPEKPPEFQFHPGSNLVVVIGSENAVNVTRKVIAALGQNH